jgi:dTDP-4-dehydrorhamnose 3,5-epimerase
MPFEFERLGIPDVILIKLRVFEDERGFFMETYKNEDFENAGIKDKFIQDNHSQSTYGVLRGLHFQREPYAQAKIVRCVRGEIYDVAVDLRKDEPTFGNYMGINLSEDNKYQLYIPRYCAHGFFVLSDVADIIYKVDNIYAPDHERGLIWNDLDVAIPWPNTNPILSLKDKQLPTLKELITEGELF